MCLGLTFCTHFSSKAQGWDFYFYLQATLILKNECSVAQWSLPYWGPVRTAPAAWAGTGRCLVHTRVFPHMGLCHSQVIADVWYNRCQNAPLIKLLLLIRIRRNAQQLKGSALILKIHAHMHNYEHLAVLLQCSENFRMGCSSSHGLQQGQDTPDLTTPSCTSDTPLFQQQKWSSVGARCPNQDFIS